MKNNWKTTKKKCNAMQLVSVNRDKKREKKTKQLLWFQK